MCQIENSLVRRAHKGRRFQETALECRTANQPIDHVVEVFEDSELPVDRKFVGKYDEEKRSINDSKTRRHKLVARRVRARSKVKNQQAQFD